MSAFWSPAARAFRVRYQQRFCRMRNRPTHEWETSMNMQRDFLLFVTLATTAAAPVLAQTATPAVGPASGATHGAAPIPDFSRVWYHPALPWFEPPASGPGPVTNRSRGPQQP